MPITTVNAADERHLHEPEYDAYLARIQYRFSNLTADPAVKLFTTNSLKLFDIYLSAFPAETRQYHNCHTCRRFFEQYGGLVTIDENGDTQSAIWHDDDTPAEYLDAIRAVSAAIRRERVTGLFLTDERKWGQRDAGGWTHFHLVPPAHLVHSHLTLTPFQRAAEVKENVRIVGYALGEFKADHLDKVLLLCQSDKLYRQEAILGQAEFLHRLKSNRKPNVLWREVASAPNGFCHPRASMIGTVIQDLEAGLPYDTVAARFKEKMDPTKYQRPQAAPAAGTIAQAEKLVEQMGLQRSFARRFARFEEIQTIWTPRGAGRAAERGGVFANVTAKGTVTAAPRTPGAATNITFDKFRRTVLDGALKIEVRTPGTGNYVGMLTAVDPDAPVLMQWGNPFSSYVYHRGSAAVAWGLRASAWYEVSGVALAPWMWGGEAHGGHHGKSAVFVIPQAKDTHLRDSALFPESMRSELHGVRAVVEAFSRNNPAQGAVDGSANGLNVIGATVRVTNALGTVEYTIDRWD